jgi:hypothetical protein
MTMTKAEVVRIICEKMGFSPKESTEIVDRNHALFQALRRQSDHPSITA